MLVFYGSRGKTLFEEIEVHLRAAKIILGLDRFTSSDKGIAHANWFPLNKL